jgi:hypothetical protein
MDIIENAVVLSKSKTCEEWDICIDGIWYGLDYTDSSDRAMLRNTIIENNLEIKGIPFWNSCDKAKNIGFKNIVYVDSDTAYLF